MKKLILCLITLFIFGTGYGQKLQVMPPSGNITAEQGDFFDPFNVNNVQNGNPNTDVLNTYALPSNGATSQNSRMPSNFWKFQRTWYLIKPDEMAASGFPSGYTVDGLGFNVTAAGTGTLTGTLNIYLLNTTNTSWTLGTTWNVSSFTQVASISNYTVPIAVGSYDIAFTGGSPFTYTGSGVYVAWEFGSPSGTIGTAPVTHDCNNSLSGLLYGGRGSTAWPAVTGTSSWRPATRFINNSINDVVSLTNIYTLERAPIPYSAPVPVTVRAANVSTSAATFDVILTIKDATNTFTRYSDTVTVTALAGGTATLLNFSWTPTIQEDIIITATTSVIGGETWTINNTKSIPGAVNDNLFSLAYTTTGSSGFGYTYPGTGLFATKFHMNGSGNVPGANIVIANFAANVGNTVYAVLMNSAGTILTQSPTYTIQSGDLGANVNFSFATPQTFTNEDFYVALAQTAGTVQWYPMGTFDEDPQRDNTFYTAAITGGTLTVLPTSFGLKYGIEAQVTAPAATVNPSAFTATPVSTTQINLSWALNPSSNNVLLAWSPDGTFGTPVDGTTYNAGNTIPGGGTVLQYSNGTSFPHTGLTPATIYYYKAWSYSGSTYSTGVGTNATTFCPAYAAPITESFETAIFPPLCWSISSGSPAWTRSTAASGYGTGSGSAFANFYNISATTPFDLISLQFDASALTNPVLRFDYAYCTYVTEVDEMDIYYSTDNGSTYTLLLAMPGGVSGALVTAPPQTASFTPTSSQWATKTISLPAGTNKVKFTAISAYGNNLYLDNVKVLNLLSHDVSVISIDEAQVVTVGSLNPKATVKNLGFNTESFNVTLSTTGYSSTKAVTSLAPEATVQVVFDPWTNSLGDFVLTACTSLGSDLNTSNDCLSASIKVMALDKTVYGYNAFPGAGTDPEGPMKFNLSDPGTLNSLADQSLLQFVSGGTWANDTWYGTVYNTVAPYDLITLDPLTGARTVIGDMGVNINGLSFNPANGTMYGVGYSSPNSQLYSINMSTGATTLIGSSSGLLINLAINNSGQAYAVNLGTDSLVSVNLTTGGITNIGPIGFNANYAQDMEFDREAGELFMAAYGLSGELRWVNTTTGNSLVVGAFEGGAEVTGFAIPYSTAVPKVVNLKIYLEGLYNGTENNQAYNELGPQWTYPIADKVTLELRSSVDGSLVLAINNVNLNVDGSISVSVDASYNGDYFIYIYHRNHLVTSTAVSFDFSLSGAITYDMTTGVGQAFGGNMKVIGGVAVIYAGDTDQSTGIDSSDMILVDNDNAAFATGYLVTDVDGNGGVDSSDMILVDNNNAAFVSAILPF